MEKRPSEGNAEQNESADSAADPDPTEQGGEESDSGDSAQKQAASGSEPADEESAEEPLSNDSSGGTSPGASASAQAPASGNATKNPAAVSLGRLGGLKGGKARARILTASERSEAARKAATARWQKNKLPK